MIYVYADMGTRKYLSAVNQLKADGKDYQLMRKNQKLIDFEADGVFCEDKDILNNWLAADVPEYTLDSDLSDADESGESFSEKTTKSKFKAGD